jgi:hypothetical protein
MENTKKIDVYLDLEFLRLIFIEAGKNQFNEKGRLIRSFVDFLEQDHVQLFFADNGEKISKYNLFQVFLGSDFESFYKLWNLQSKSDYKYNKDFEFESIKNPFVFFFGEEYSTTDFKDLNKPIFFSNHNNFSRNWKAISSSRNIHINSSDNVTDFWQTTLYPEIMWGDSFVIVEPFLSNWDVEVRQIRRAGNNTFKDNISAIINLLKTTKEGVSLILLSKVNNNLIQEKREHTKNNLETIENINYQVFMFNENNAKTYNEQNTDRFPVEKIWNYIHDRYIYTNYFVINSAHSWDYIQENENGEKHIPKNTQITIQSIVKKDVFEFMISKLKNYKELIDLTKKEEFVSIHETIESTNIDNKLIINL